MQTKVTRDDLITAVFARLEAARRCIQTRRALEVATGNMRTARDVHVIAIQDNENALREFEQMEARLLMEETGAVAGRMRAVS